MQIKHTPGPWETDKSEHDHPYQDITVRDTHGRHICQVWIDDAPVPDYNAKQNANARLIAEAPMMFDILSRAAHVIESLDGTTTENERLVDDYRALKAKFS